MAMNFNTIYRWINTAIARAKSIHYAIGKSLFEAMMVLFTDAY